MSRIKVTNSSIYIDNYTMGESQSLEKNFTTWDPLTHKYERCGMYYDERINRLYLPRGIDIGKIKGYLNEKYHDVIDPIPAKEIDDILMKYAPRDEDQKQTLRFMCSVNEYKANEREPQLCVNLLMGKGKTYCAIGAISYLKLKSIIITHSTTLLNQWKENMKEYTNLTDSDILFLNGTPMLNMILNGKSKLAEKAKIFLCTHATIRSFGETYGWEKLNELFKILGIGIKVIDEAHKNFNNMLMIDFYTNVKMSYYLTATAERSDYSENRIYQLSIKNVPNIDLFDENNDPHTSYVALKWNSRPTAIQIESCKNMYGLDRNKYVDYVTKQPNFYRMMRIIMDMVIKCNGKCLMYIGTNKGILRVYKWIGENYIEFAGQVGIFTSLVNKEQKLIEREKRLILSTTKSAGEGEDIKGLKMTIVLAEPFKSSVLAKQTLGRTRDSGTMYVELVDMGFKQIKNYYYAKLGIFNKHASDTSDTVIDQYELEKRSESIEEKRNPKHLIEPFEFCDNRFFGEDSYEEDEDED